MGAFDLVVDRKEYSIAIDHDDATITAKVCCIESEDRYEHDETFYQVNGDFVSDMLADIETYRNDCPTYRVMIHWSDSDVPKTPRIQGIVKSTLHEMTPELTVNLRAQDHVDRAGNTLYKMQDIGSIFAQAVNDFKGHYAFIGAEYGKLIDQYETIIKYREDPIDGVGATPEEILTTQVMKNTVAQLRVISKNLTLLGSR